jgi:hypothetical protein
MPSFLIRRSSPNDYVSGILPAGAAVIGTAYKISTKDAATGINTFALADGDGFTGFITKPVRTTAGLSDVEIAFNMVSTYSSGEIMTPYEQSKPASVEEALDLEVEGPDNVLTTSGATGAVTALTSVGTRLSFAAGKFYVAQSGDLAYYKLIAQMTPTEGGDVRIFVTRDWGVDVS